MDFERVIDEAIVLGLAYEELEEWVEEWRKELPPDQFNFVAFILFVFGYDAGEWEQPTGIPEWIRRKVLEAKGVQVLGPEDVALITDEEIVLDDGTIIPIVGELSAETRPEDFERFAQLARAYWAEQE